MERYINDNGMSSKVKMVGYVRDPYRYYAISDIYVSTSCIEGFQYSLLESQAYGMPAVMYELPYLRLVEQNDSCIQVKQGDYNTAARQIIDLIKDGDRRRKLQEVARKHARTIIQKDRSEEWRELLSSLEIGFRQVPNYTYVDLLLEHMALYTEEECERVKDTKAYRIGKCIVMPLKKIKKGLSIIKKVIIRH